ncbi:hypothetical protein RHAB21_03845 [Pseudorhizobium halotolerans]|uniref:Uncharacterized protein n=1 Tax=Pseudorhizobium halotolerans TaxID=1233081 RepID=A0ABN7JWG5_9HYPH|nr:hypothetical protein RHAB21_03845 [Pseudorhizobium halotolerans]
MASPLRFLRRLVSGRGERKQDADVLNEAKPDVLAIADATEPVAGEAAPPAALEPPDQEPHDAVYSETASVDEAATEIGVTADSIPAFGGLSSAGEPGVAVTATDAMEFQPAVEVPARKQKAPSKYSRPAVVADQVLQGSRSQSDDTISLDDEIKVLRAQLASKLRIQNAQLKKMLERFER